MIVVKLVDSFFIVGICTYLGINKAQKFSIRVMKLQDLKKRSENV